MDHNSQNLRIEATDDKMGAFIFVKCSFKYGLLTFYKLGKAWWLMIAIYTLFQILYYQSNHLINTFPKFIQAFIHLSSGIFNFMLLLPIIIIGLDYFNKGSVDKIRLKTILSIGKSYFFASLIFHIVWLPIYFYPLLISLSKTKKYSSDSIFIGPLCIVLMFYILCRLFPLIIIVVDKKSTPSEAFKTSLRITANNLIPIFTLIIFMVPLYFILNIILFKITIIVWVPIAMQTFIYAYKQLEHAWETKGRSVVLPGGN